MFLKIPFEKTIEFKTNISEITKMSLEHEYNINDDAVLGNFYINGEYKVHSVSVNKELFNYTLPFTVELTSRIKKDTLEFNIEDFTYEVIDDNKLHVNIEYSIKAEEELFQKVDEREFEEELDDIEDFFNEKGSEVNNEEDRQIDRENEKNSREDEKREQQVSIMDTIKSSDDTFVTYHVHIVREDETIDSVCKKYGVSNNIVMEYNDIDNLSLKDKILIPEIDE